MTLHQVIEKTKKLLIAVGVITLGVLLVVFLVNVGRVLKERYFPDQKPPPTFGKLQPTVFPRSSITRKLLYRIDTLSGTLPTFPKELSVFAISQPQPSLLSLQKAKAGVAKIGFVNDPVTFSDTLYLWNDEAPPFRKLILDVVSLRFLLLSNFYLNEEVLRATNLPRENEAVQIAQSFLSTILLPDDIDEAKTKTTLFAINNSKLVETTKAANANVIEVDFFQRMVNDLPIYYGNHPHSLMQVFIAGGREPSVVQANFSYQRVDASSSLYPLTTAEEAFKLLQEGKGYIASYKGSSNDVVIRNALLGYYLGEKKQEHLVPIVVFEGDDDFIAFVPAVTNEWIRK